MTQITNQLNSQKKNASNKGNSVKTNNNNSNKGNNSSKTSKNNKTANKNKPNVSSQNTTKDEINKPNKVTRVESVNYLEGVLNALNPSSLQQAIILSEIINEPMCKRRRRARNKSVCR